MHNIVLFGEMLADVFPKKTVLGGAPYNVARHLQSFQQHPVLISRAGADALKDKFFNALSRLNMSPLGIQVDPVYPTGKVTVQIENNTHRFDICPNQAYDYIDANEAINIACATQPNIVYFGSLVQRNGVSSSALYKLLNNTACPKFLDINLREPWYNKKVIEYSLLSADIVKVNEDELAIIANVLEFKTKNNKAHALTLIEQFKLTYLFITLGEKGAWALSNKKEMLSVGGQEIEATLVDTVGAGDAFSAISILGTLYNWPLALTLNRANAFASTICQIRGATPENNQLYANFLKSWSMYQP